MSRDHSQVLHLKSWGPEGSVKGNAPWQKIDIFPELRPQT